jgi:hypothetical protein
MAKKTAETKNTPVNAPETPPAKPVNAPEAPPAKPEAPPKPVKPKMENKNGVTMPSPGTRTRRIWDVSEQLSKQTGATAERGKVMEICLAEGLNKATVATQYGRWCKFHGITKVVKKQEKASAAPPAPPATPEAPPATPAK